MAWEFLLAAVNAFSSASAAQDQNAARQEAYERQRAQDEQNRKLAKEDASNKFVDMRNAAQKAGFNPLTALRMTGAAGFGAYGGYTAQVPVLSKVNFSRSIGTSLVSAYATMKINEPIDKYNKEIRELEKAERKAELALKPLQGALMKAQLEELKKPKKEDRVYLYERDGSPKLNAYGQHMYVGDAAAEAFPAMQAYVTGDGRTFSAPHEQLLDMGFGGMAAALGTIAAGPSIEQSDKAPTAFRYPRLIKQDDGNWARPSVKTFPSKGTFWTQPSLSF